jgi:eukaryotic-like serine/threonine-protein kinase
VKDRDPSPRFVITTVFLFVVLTISAITFEYSPSQHTIIQQEALAQPAPSFLTYDNPTHGIKMQYPADWTVSTNGLQSYSDIVGFFSPLQNLTDVLPAQVALSVMSYSANVSLDEYTNMTLTEIEQQGLEVNESNGFTLAGNPGYRIIFSPPPQTVPVSLSVMQVWTVINDKVYLLAYTAEGSEFQNNLSLVQQMLDSLQVQPKQKP